MATLSTNPNGTTSPRRQRYNRASTTSVTQLLSDGYSSFINRLTRRGPSEKNDTICDSKLSTARSRFDEKLLADKNSVLSNMRRYDNSHISPYASLTSIVAPSARIAALHDDRTYSNYLGSQKSRLETSPLRSTSGISALGRSDSFRRAHVKDNKSPIIKRYPLKEPNNNIDNTIFLGSTRSRLEDKYSSVLDRIAIQKKEKARKDKEDRDKTLEPEPLSRGLMRSLTTAVFGENSFKRNNYSREKTRDKTPFRNTSDRRLSSTHRQKEKDIYKNGYDVALRDKPYFGKDRDSIYRKHNRRSLRVEKSENSRKMGKLSLRPIDLNIQSGVRDLVSPPQEQNDMNLKLAVTKTPASSPIRETGRQKQIYFPSSDEDDDKTPVGDIILAERETRRKEIQGLIMKYAHLDEVYGRITDKEPKEVPSEIKPVKKTEPLDIGDVVALPPELRSRQRPQRPRHQMRRAATPPVSTR